MCIRDRPENEQLEVNESFEPLAEMDADQQPEGYQATKSPVALSSSSTSTSIIPDKPHQPFPSSTIGKQRRSFCSSWYSKYPWLHYQEASDSVLCFYCHLPVTLNKEDAFITAGFSNWKKAFEKFNTHKKSIAHHQAVELVEKIPKTTKNIGDMLSSTHAQQKAENKDMLKIILSSIRFFGRQGLALRGYYKTADGSNVGSEEDSNFLQLLKTRAEDHPQLLKWMERSQDKFLSPDVQNEILSIIRNSQGCFWEMVHYHGR